MSLQRSAWEGARKKPRLAASLALLCVLVPSVAAAAASSPKSRVDELIASKQYLTAARKLWGAEGFDRSPEQIAKYVILVTDNYAFTFNFRIFALRDLEADQSIEDVRGKPGQYEIVGGDLEELLREWEKRFPDDPNIQLALGHYLSRSRGCGCQTSLDHYDAGAGEPYRYLKAAYDGGRFTPWSLFQLGVHQHQQGQLNEAMRFYELSLEAGFQEPGLLYNYAGVLHGRGRYAEALPFAERAVAGYSDPALKSDAYHVQGTLLWNLDRREEAEASFRACLEQLRWHPGCFADLATLLKEQSRFEDYKSLVLGYVGMEYGNTFMFNHYVELLQAAGVAPVDGEIERKLLALLPERSTEEVGALSFNLARMSELVADKEEAIARYKRALLALQGLDAPPPGAIETITARIQILEAEHPSPGQQAPPAIH